MARSDWFIVRDTDNDFKYVLKTRSLKEAVARLDADRAAGKHRDIVGKNQYANRLFFVTQDEQSAARGQSPR